MLFNVHYGCTFWSSYCALRIHYLISFHHPVGQVSLSPIHRWVNRGRKRLTNCSVTQPVGREPGFNPMSLNSQTFHKATHRLPIDVTNLSGCRGTPIGCLQKAIIDTSNFNTSNKMAASDSVFQRRWLFLTLLRTLFNKEVIYFL